MNRWLKAVLIFLPLAALIIPWYSDEGWNLIITHQWLDTGKMGYVLKYNDAQLTFLKPYIWSAGWIAKLVGFTSYFPFRLLSTIFSGLTLLLIYKSTEILKLKPLARKTAVGLMLLSLIYGTGFLFRPDAAVIFSITLGIWATLNLEQKKLFPAATALIFQGIIFTIHPNGLLGILVSLLGIVFFAPKDRLWVFGMSGLISLVMVISILFYGTTFYEWWQNLILITGATDGVHRNLWLTEYKRYLYFGIEYPYLIPVLFTIALALPTYLPLKKEKYENFLILTVVIGVIFLLFNPTKWSHYLFLLWPPLVVLCGVAINKSKKSTEWLRQSLILSLTTMFILGINFLKNNDQLNYRVLRNFGRGKRLDQVVNLVKNKNILASPVFFPFLNQSTILIPNVMQTEKPDYVISRYDQDQNGLEFVTTFRFNNDIYYNLFKVNNE